MGKDSNLNEFKLETLGLVSSGIAHDINNVLSIIEGHCEMLQHEYPGFAGAAHIEQISQAVMRGGYLAKQLLSLSNQLPYSVESIQARTALESALSLVENIVPANISLNSVIDTDLYIQADLSTFVQVIVNIISNSVAAMQPGGGEISISLKQDEQKKSVLLVISDLGKGMGSNELDKVYDPFFSTKAQKKPGSGFGMSMVKAIVREMGGDIELYSQKGKGTTVSVKLPVCPFTHELELELAEGDTELDDINTMLLVEDDQHLANIYQMLMLDAGFVVTHATNGVEGFNLYQSQGPFDVVLTDEQMPQRRGSDMARMIRQLAPEQVIILLSGFHDENIEACLAEGVVNSTLTKPVKLMELVDTIKAHMNIAGS